jgi:DNA-directed RNA polymerase alpha subunit
MTIKKCPERLSRKTVTNAKIIAALNVSVKDLEMELRIRNIFWICRLLEDDSIVAEVVTKSVRYFFQFPRVGKLGICKIRKTLKKSGLDLMDYLDNHVLQLAILEVKKVEISRKKKGYYKI